MKTFKEFLSEDQWYNEPQFKKQIAPITSPVSQPGTGSGMTIGELERRTAAGEIKPMIMDDDPFVKAQKRMGEAMHKQKQEAQRRRGRPPTPEEEAADRLKYSIS